MSNVNTPLTNSNPLLNKFMDELMNNAGQIYIQMSGHIYENEVPTNAPLPNLKWKVIDTKWEGCFGNGSIDYFIIEFELQTGLYSGNGNTFIQSIFRQIYLKFQHKVWTVNNKPQGGTGPDTYAYDQLKTERVSPEYTWTESNSTNGKVLYKIWGFENISSFQS